MSANRYYSLNDYCKEVFGEKVYRLSLSGGMTCPNRDGTLGTRGCIFCSEGGSGDFAAPASLSITDQIHAGQKLLSAKRPVRKYIAYFQSFTNTYADINILKEKYETILKLPNVIGLSIATRCDAISDECLDYLEDLSKRTFLTIELGLQSMYDKTLKLINRGHDLKSFDECVKKLKQRNINVVVHIINGLPFETKDMMLATVKYLNSLKIDGIKIHMLHVLKNTELEKLYNETHFHILTKEEYIDIVCDELELLDEKIVIHRITGDPTKEDLIEPTWLLKKFCVLNDIDKEMVRRNSYQGKRQVD